MTIKKIVQFASWPVAIGVILALLALLLSPNFRPTKTVVVPQEVVAPTSYAEAVSHAAPAVVNIYNEKIVQRDPRYFNNPYYKRYFNATNIPQRTLGSGVIMDKSGIILTNNHVINGADQIKVFLNDGRETTADIIGVDSENDLAVLKIDLPNLSAISIGQSNNLRVGDVVLAIGNPYGVGQSVTQGIVSGLGRYGLNITGTENFIQTDAAINPGNSGGALIDAHGNLIGINTAILDEKGSTSVGISFAVPADIAITSLKQILQYGHIKHVWLGFTVNQSLKSTVNQLEVIEIQAKSPVDIAGMQVGDILLQLNNTEITDVAMAKKLISNIELGSEVKIKVKRKGEIKELKLTAQALPQSPQ